ncbi:NUDIX domain-containing protein [Alkalispirochaeta americana]|uniref:NUDIX domain-containing protein n=1 Tax=Alkalispirochaeta americana TaxID=159291 RepID=A0A1N6N8H8_9SPIO|nr:CoA pyrophosphatase [Alkalispirochaeta americana]SIP88365.1 NUDIX domain-containing protein [Alkalispirochaeta americana]
MTQEQQFHRLLGALQAPLHGPAANLPGYRAHKQMAPFSGAHPHRTHSGSCREGAVLIVLIPRYSPDGLEVLIPLIERSRDGGPHSGQLALPGGGREEQDTDLTATALRETLEETGLETGRCTVMGSLSPLTVAVSSYLVTPVVAFTESPLETIRFSPNPREVARILLISPAHLTEKAGTARLMVHGVARTVPAYILDSRPLWGATAMILAELLALLPLWPRTSREYSTLSQSCFRAEPAVPDDPQASGCNGTKSPG